MESSERDVAAGHAIYSKATLTLYDFLVLGVSNRWIWQCPTSVLLTWYRTHLSLNHLDIGVGTGFFLYHGLSQHQDRIVLVDLNHNCLEVTARRIKRYKPKCYQRNALDPLELDEKAFDSIGLNYLLHCLPGDISDKGVVFDHAYEYLKPGGRVFGSTLLQGGVDRSILARRLMKLYNTKGIFFNQHDSLDALKTTLANRFRASDVKVVGCAALFWASK